MSRKGIGSAGRNYPDTKIKPASTALSIWVVIYFLQGGFVTFQACCWPNAANSLLQVGGVGLWFAGACLCNCLWIIVYVEGTIVSLWVSTGLLFALLACILKIYVNCGNWKTSRCINEEDHLLTMLLVTLFDGHFSMYAAWCTVACIITTSTALNTTGWSFGDASVWAAAMLTAAFCVNVAVVITRQDFVFPAVLCWSCHCSR